MRAALLLVLTGCSFVATEAPRPPPYPTSCNRDMKPVVADVLAVAGAALAAGISGAEHAPSAGVWIPLGVAGVSGASSVYGVVQVGRCRTEFDKRPSATLADMPAVM